MTTLGRTLDYLERKAIPYLHTTHSPALTARELAHAEHLPPYKVAKTVVFHDDVDYGMAVVRADEYVDFEQLRGLLNSGSVRLATEDELSCLFPACELGAMPPFGNLFGLPVYIDRSLLASHSIAFNAGTHRDLIHMNMADYLRIVDPVISDFAMHAESMVAC